MKHFRFVILFLCSSVSFFAQDALFLNYQQSLIYSNPSFAGSNGFIRSQNTYRLDPYLGFSTAFTSVDGYVKSLKAGFALSAFSDDMHNGTTKNSNLSFTYAQRINTKRLGLLIPSLQMSYGLLTLDKTRLNFGDAVNARYGEIWNSTTALPAQRKEYFNLGLGLRVSLSDEQMGISVSNINRPDIGLTGPLKLPVRTSFYFSQNIHDGSWGFNNVSLFGNYQAGTYNFVIRGTMAKTKFLVFGGGYVGIGNNQIFNQGFIANIGFHWKVLTLLYGYNQICISNSDYHPVTGSHEISLSLSFGIKSLRYDLLGTYAERW